MPHYFDNAATTKPLYASQVPWMWGNPSSPHTRGRTMHGVLEDARAKIGNIFGITAEGVLVTSGGTESINLVLSGHWDAVVSTRMEHDATHRFLLQTQIPVLYLANTDTGLIDLEQTRRQWGVSGQTLQGQRTLISLIHTNNVIGTTQPTELLRAVLDFVSGFGASARLHLDCVQTIGHRSLRLDTEYKFVDFVSCSAHKFHGPPGVGFLLARDTKGLRPLLHGGTQQAGLRPGTESPWLVHTTADVLARLTHGLTPAILRMSKIQQRIYATLQPFVVSGTVRLTGDLRERSCHHVSFCIRNRSGLEFVALLDRAGVQASSGSACSKQHGLSHVLQACNLPVEYIQGHVRLTCSNLTTDADVTALCFVLRSLLSK